MTLTTGARLGPYEIVGAIGAGGMGEVYRARDARLNRDVAIKVLPAALSTDSERRVRFEREARVLAALNHPNIAAIYGIEDAGGAPGLVMELVEGPSLRDVISAAGRGMPLDEALPIARQIAEALEAAHGTGVVHRDLKPDNIKIQGGRVKLLDFGLAKALDPSSATAGDLANSPTMTSPAMTAQGIILGTAAYMSPEQARGKTVDRRADLWALGCVLFEMLTGRRVFTGETVTDVLAAVVRSEPDWASLPADTPRPIRTLLHRCLAKDPAQRIADASTARLEIDDARREGEGERLPAVTAAPASRARVAWLAAAVMAAVATAAIVFALTRTPLRPTVAPEVRIDLDYGSDSAVLSPDGSTIVYFSRQANSWLARSLHSGSESPLPGTVGASTVFWSPDNQSLGIQVEQKLKRLDLATSTVRSLADAPTPRGGSWGSDGTILFAPGGNGPLYRVPAAGGTAVAVTELTPPQTSHRYPIWLPDGRRFLLYVLGPSGVRGEYLGSIDDKRLTRLVDTDGPASLAPPDTLLFFREGVLYAQRFDRATAMMRGDAVPVTSGFEVNQTAGPRVTASQTGVLAFARDPDVVFQLQWVDRAGKLLSTVGPPIANVLRGSLSPDGQTIAVIRSGGVNTIWLMDVARGTLSRFNEGSSAAWSPDGSRIAFSSGRDGFTRAYWQRVGVNEPAELLAKSNEAQNIIDWSPDGEHIVFSSQSASTGRDLWLLATTGTPRVATPLVQTPAQDNNGAISPDGKWFIYESNEQGPFALFVRPFPGPGRAWRVSAGAGTGPHWRADTREIYFLGDADTFTAVSFDPNNGTPRLGVPVPLFRLRGRLLKARTDGQRFLLATPVDPAPTAQSLTLIVNWVGAAAGK